MSCDGCVDEPRLTGYGAVWQFCDPATGEWVTYMGTKDVTAPTRSRAGELDTTEGDGGGWKTFAPNPLKQLEEVSVTGNLLIEQYNRLWQLFEDDVVTRWRQVLTQIAAQPYIEFCAFISQMDEEHPMEDLSQQNIALRPSGAPTKGILNE